MNAHAGTGARRETGYLRTGNPRPVFGCQGEGAVLAPRPRFLLGRIVGAARHHSRLSSLSKARLQTIWSASGDEVWTRSAPIAVVISPQRIDLYNGFGTPGAALRWYRTT